MSTIGLPRFGARTAPLTDAERGFIRRLGSTRTRNAALLQVSVETYEELANPLGRVRPVTLARVRAKIAELQQEQEQETT